MTMINNHNTNLNVNNFRKSYTAYFRYPERFASVSRLAFETV